MEKTMVGRRSFTVAVHKDETKKQDYAKALETGLTTTTFKDYARDVVARALALQNEQKRGA